MSTGLDRSCVPHVVNVPKCSPANLRSLTAKTDPSLAISNLPEDRAWALTKLLFQQRLPPTTRLCNTLQHKTEKRHKKRWIWCFTQAKLSWNKSVLIVQSADIFNLHTSVPCPTVTRTPISQHPLSYQEHLAGSHEASNHTLGKLQQLQPAAMWRLTRAECRWETATKSSGLSLVFLLFRCLPVSHISPNMLITLVFAFLVSSVSATKKGKLL